MPVINQYLETAKPYVIGLFRAVTGFLFLGHGASSLFGIWGGSMGMGEGKTVEFGVWPYWWAALIQFAAGLLVLGGLFTRTAALVASGSMAYAYFVEHQGDALLPLQNHGEAAAMFCWAFFLIIFTGPGALALDQLLPGRRGAAAEPTAKVPAGV
ncbi:DoxX family protein [Kitasatospora sp. NPDC094028]